MVCCMATLQGCQPFATYRNFNAVVGRPFRVALLRVQTVARLKPCPTYKKSCRMPNYKEDKMDILRQVSELKEFLGKVYIFIEENEDSFKDGVEAEGLKNETWQWMQQLAKFLPEI